MSLPPSDPKTIATDFFNEGMEMVARGARIMYDAGASVEQVQDEIRTTIVALQMFIEHLNHV